MTRVANKHWNSGDSFRVGKEIHTVVGFYMGGDSYYEMFTKVNVEHDFVDDDLTEYVCWDNSFPDHWTFNERSTLTELDLVCRLFHKGDKGR